MNNSNDDSIMQSSLSDVTQMLLDDIKKEKKALIRAISDCEVNLEISRKESNTINSNLVGTNNHFFKVNDISTKDSNIQSKENVNKLEEKLLHLKDDYNVILTKEQNLSRINEYFHNKPSNYNNITSDDCLCDDVDGLKLLKTQEIERKRIARELHDSIVQNLTNLVHKTELCTKLVDMDPIRAKLELQTMINTIKTTINEMRNVIYDLRPMSLDDLGLVITVSRYIKQFIDSNRIKVSLNVENERKIFSDIIDLTLFRIIQEACNNALKHANATEINISLIYNEDSINLTIEDNGCGFDQTENKVEKYSENKSLHGFGLPMMKERVGLLSGKLDIESKVNKGTKVSVCVPI